MTTVFGALNRFISRLDADQPVQAAPNNACGFQVLRNLNTDLPLEPWYDFIIGINGRSIDNPDPSLLAAEIRNCAGSSISLGVYSAKGAVIREQYVNVPADSATLGLSMQWTPLSTTEDVWHILDVATNSPADLAGLLPYSDYVIGSPDGSMHGENGLPDVIERHISQNLRLYVYNNEYDVTRTVEISPSRAWGGEGALGCVLGFGALHRVPPPLNEPSQAPGETLFETARFSNEETRPSPSQQYQQNGVEAHPPSTPSIQPPMNSGIAVSSKNGRKARAVNAAAVEAGLDDLFKEGEEKSKELDRTITPAHTSSLPPPPKGGPPRATKSPGPPKDGTAPSTSTDDA